MVETAVDQFLTTLDLDDLGRARAEIARALAQKLDAAAVDKRASVILAVASISKELREALVQLSADDTEVTAWAQSLFTE